MYENTQPETKESTAVPHVPAMASTVLSPATERVAEEETNKPPLTPAPVLLSFSDTAESLSPEIQLPATNECLDDEADVLEEDIDASELSDTPVMRVKKRKRQLRTDAAELRLMGRRALCKRIAEIAPDMLKMVKLRILASYLQSVRGLEDDDLTQVLRKDADKLAERHRIVNGLATLDPDFQRGQLKTIIYDLLLQEETYSLEENRLDEKVIDFEKALVKRSKGLDLSELKKQAPDLWHPYETYRVVLEAAWGNDGVISPDEARLLEVLRVHLGISREEHWLLNTLLKRFPKEKCALHTPDEINEARKELQRGGLLWSYRDENNRTIDVIPFEIASVVRRDCAGQELQRTNYRRLLHQDGITVSELRNALEKRGLNRSGNKPELIERIVSSDIKPTEVLNDLDKDKLSAMCNSFWLKGYGNKAELIERLIDFYDDLTFEERVTKDEREVAYNNYELLACRSYAELRAKKIICKDLDIEYLFEEATAFLFEARLGIACDRSHKDNRADGRLPLENDQSILWDCKSVESLVNLQDHLEGQFDGYLRKERESGKQPLAFLVIGPAFTPQSLKLAYQYKARTNWDIALVTAEGLKHLADRWSATEPHKPFPIRLFNRTDIIDKERAEFLLSLA